MKHTSLTHTRPHARTCLYVLIACEESQAECKAFRELGHIAYSCDIQPCRPTGNPSWHIQGDVTPYLQGVTQFTTQDGSLQSVPRFDLIIAHPPCTYLCKVSSVHMVIDGIPLGGCNRSWLGRSPLRFRRVVCGAVLPAARPYGAGAPTRVRYSPARGRSLLPPLRLTRLHLRYVLPPLSLHRSPLAPCRSG